MVDFQLLTFDLQNCFLTPLGRSSDLVWLGHKLAYFNLSSKRNLFNTSEAEEVVPGRACYVEYVHSQGLGRTGSWTKCEHYKFI